LYGNLVITRSKKDSEVLSLFYFLAFLVLKHYILGELLRKYLLPLQECNNDNNTLQAYPRGKVRIYGA